MTVMNDLQPNKEEAFAVEVVEILRHEGFTAYWAGGCVRDLILGLRPRDYDVATNATPDEIQQVFRALRYRTLGIGKSFGVIAVLGRRGAGQVEVATFRQDATYSDGRHPDAVCFSTPEEDALRRDFTINGMFYDPISQEVVDYVGGQDDLSNGVIRAIGDPDQRISEDKLRMIRAVRFTSRFNFQLDPATLEAIRRRPEEINVVSVERIVAEMRRVLVNPSRREGMQLLLTSGLLPYVLPELRPLTAKTGDAWIKLLMVMEQLPDPTFACTLAAVLRPTLAEGEDGLEAAERIGERWKLSRDEIRDTGFFLSNEKSIRRAKELPWPTVQRILIEPGARELVTLTETIVIVEGEPTAGPDFCHARLAQSPEVLNPPPLLTGDDLKELNIPTGPFYRDLLTAVRDAQLEGRVNDRASAEELVRELLKKV